MNADDATRHMVDLVNSERPFTADERAAIMKHIDFMVRFLRTNEQVWSASLLVSHVSAVLVGIIIAKVFL